uniref:Uncharacterized protein n=1 Tax=Desertifilum tharense IPPAS B-1220 TaxID=1781255 RepID=A0ACD5H2K3_9CYAN
MAATASCYASQQAQQIEAQLQQHPILSEDIKSQLQQCVLHLRQLLQGSPVSTSQPPVEKDSLTQLASRVQFTRDFEQLLHKVPTTTSTSNAGVVKHQESQIAKSSLWLYLWRSPFVPCRQHHRRR